LFKVLKFDFIYIKRIILYFVDCSWDIYIKSELPLKFWLCCWENVFKWIKMGDPWGDQEKNFAVERIKSSSFQDQWPRWEPGIRWCCKVLLSGFDNRFCDQMRQNQLNGDHQWRGEQPGQQVQGGHEDAEQARLQTVRGSSGWRLACHGRWWKPPHRSIKLAWGWRRKISIERSEKCKKNIN